MCIKFFRGVGVSQGAVMFFSPSDAGSNKKIERGSIYLLILFLAPFLL